MQEQQERRELINNNLLNIICGVIFALFFILFIRHQILLLNYIGFGDEQETIVATKMISDGSRLYSQIFNQHGPLIFLPGLIIEKIGDFGIKAHRIPILILQIIALISIYFSPLFRNRLTRTIYTVIAASILAIYLPDVYSHMYIYQAVAGLFLVIIFSQYVLPAIIIPRNLSFVRIILGNFLIGSLLFLAISYLPLAIIIFLVSAKRGNFKIAFLSLFASLVFNTIFLVYIGSFLGYLAFHIYLNTVSSPTYGNYNFINFSTNVFQGITSSIADFGYFLLILSAIAYLASAEKGIIRWRSMAIGLGLISLLIRGSGFPSLFQPTPGFHALPYYYSGLALPIVFFRNEEKLNGKIIIFISILLMVLFTKLSLMVPGDMERIKTQYIPQSTEFSRLAKFFTSAEDKIIAYSFKNFEYIASRRLPASGNFFYLPWQEKYNENPKLGIKIDACQDIKKNKPKVMLIDKWNVYERYPWESYASCVQQIIDKQYFQIPNQPYYIRKDIVTDDFLETIEARMQYEITPSSQLIKQSPYKLKMIPNDKKSQSGLRRIGILFGTHNRQDPGEAELNLRSSDNIQTTRHFSLLELEDNQYFFLNLNPEHDYSSGELVLIDGNDVKISIWESKNKNESKNIKTCLIYEYTDGKLKFTHGCPLPF